MLFMRHRMPRSARPRSHRHSVHSAPRRRPRALIALASTLAVAAGGAVLLARPPAGLPAVHSFALQASAKQSAVTHAAQHSAGGPASRPAAAAPPAAAGTAGVVAQDPMDTLRTIQAAANVPGPAAQHAAAQHGAAQHGAAQHGAAQPAAAEHAGKGAILPDGGKKPAGGPAAANPNCTLVVPSNPTSAQGLTTPYQLTTTSRRAGACHEANSDQSAFVEAAILDTDSGAISTYRPLVIDAGDQPAQPPVPVQIPAHAVVAVWFGYNGDTLTLSGPGAHSCVNGMPGSPFGQFAYCNAPAFFTAANAAIASGKLTVPALGTGTDGLPCPTTRDFSVVDQDQSDNLTTTYRIINGRMAQDTPKTQGGTALTNGSDEGLLASAIDPALGCHPFTAPDQTNGGAPTPALALNELSAAANQADPMALVPTSDPMVLVRGQASVAKTNLYRAGVDQQPLPAGQTPTAYCTDLMRLAPARLDKDAALLRAAGSPDPGSNNLLSFLTTRLQTSVGNLGCMPAK
jgi:hypothetical protein